MKRRILFRAAPSGAGGIDLLAQVYEQVAPNPESLRGCASRLFKNAKPSLAHCVQLSDALLVSAAFKGRFQPDTDNF
jgi:hypothetical protein